ncbi:MAG TPA: hypothetical protein DCZ76_02775 [Treponema sp.]|nr:hypothetical protein [Treponema sp.]
MKKIISVLFLVLTVSLFSSCIIVGDPDIFTTEYYDITCYNKSNTKIHDWCVVRNNNVTYAKSKKICCPIDPYNGEATLKNLPAGTYVLYVAFVPSPDYDEGDYVPSKTIKLDHNYEVYIDDTFVDEYLSN